MNKYDIVAALAEKHGSTKVDAAKMYDSFCGVMVDALKAGKDLNLIGVGKIYLTESDERQGRNPKTGEVVEIPAKTRIRFRASWPLKQAVAMVTPVTTGGAAVDDE